jgi:cellobiose-specific phosphotransferase system component IIC
MEISIPAELLFAVGVALFCMSLFLYARILKRLLAVIRRESGIWVLPMVGAGFLALGAIFHFIPLAIYPQLDPSRTDQLMQLCQNRSAEAAGIFLAGIISILAGWMYTRWTSR